MQDLVPSINEDGSPSTSNAKASKAVVLQKAIDHIQVIQGVQPRSVPKKQVLHSPTKKNCTSCQYNLDGHKMLYRIRKCASQECISYQLYNEYHILN